MPRIARLVALDLPHHVTQRGNYRLDIFKTDSDRQIYLKLLLEESRKFKLDVLAYCLMTNHVHFIAIPREADSLANTFKYVNMKYSQYFNEKKGERGHLFHGRFFSSVMDERYMITCARYIERNPVRAGMIENAWDWEWSSALVHCQLEQKDPFQLNKLFECSDIVSRNEWKQFISEPDNPQETLFIKKETIKGRPLADTSFISILENKFSRPLRPNPKGRPKKEQGAAIKSVSVPI